MKNLLTSSIISEVGKIMGSRKYGWNDKCTEVSLETMIEGFAVYLGRNKSKDTPLAIKLVDMNDKFHFGMYVQYIKQEEDNGEEGSWNLGMTFNENDIDSENWNVVKYPDDPVLMGIVADVGYTVYGAHFKFVPKDSNGVISEGSPQEIFCTIIDVVADYMRSNVAIDPDLELPKYFTMTAKLEGDGSVYIGVQPSALIKQHIKEDSLKKNVGNN